MSHKRAEALCPCGRTNAKQQPLRYAQCCGAWIEQEPTQPAPDAHSLMRSRYSAFVLENAAYLLATWHPSTRPSQLDFEPHTQWLGLEVRAHRLTSDTTAEVEFVARYRIAGRAVRLHERSRFVKEASRWFYVDGDDLRDAGKDKA